MLAFLPIIVMYHLLMLRWLHLRLSCWMTMWSPIILHQSLHRTRCRSLHWLAVWHFIRLAIRLSSLCIIIFAFTFTVIFVIPLFICRKRALLSLLSFFCSIPIFPPLPLTVSLVFVALKIGFQCLMTHHDHDVKHANKSTGNRLSYLDVWMFLVPVFVVDDAEKQQNRRHPWQIYMSVLLQQCSQLRQVCVHLHLHLPSSSSSFAHRPLHKWSPPFQVDSKLK